jgi:hypothetical protein
MERFIQVNVLSWIREHIAGSTSGETVTIKIRRDSDGYWWNFSTLAFASAAASGSMTFDADGVWKASFTPDESGSYSTWITYGESDSFHTLEAVGSPAPADYSGTYLISKSDIKSALNITDTTHDTWLDTQIAREQKEAEKYCHYAFNRATYTEYHDGDGSSIIMLKNLPIESITSIHDDPDRVYDSEHLIDSTDYVLYSGSGKVQLDGLITTIGLNNIKVIYVAGYGAGAGQTTPPEDIKKALILLVIASFKEMLAANESLEGEGDRAKPYFLRRQAYDILSHYVRMEL